MKNLKKKALLTVIFLLLIFVLFGIFYFFNLSSKIQAIYYSKKNNISLEIASGYLTKAREYKNKINKEENNFDYYIELARIYENLGNINKAKAVYLSYDKEKDDTVFYLYSNNLAKLYEKEENYQEANALYLEIVKKFNSTFPGTFLNMTENFIKLGDKDNAWKYYVEYQKTGKNDLDTLKLLEKM